MDPADTEANLPGFSLHQAVSSQGIQLGQHSQALHDIIDTLNQLSISISRIEGQQAHPPPGPPAPPPPPALPVSNNQPREPFVPAPERYDGCLGECKTFLFQCSLVFGQQPLTYANDTTKIAYVLGLLTGRARSWGAAFWNSPLTVNATYQQFTTEITSVFDHPITSSDTSNRLLSLRQGSTSIADYSVEFCTLAAEVGWGDQALQRIFYLFIYFFGLFMALLIEQLKI